MKTPYLTKLYDGFMAPPESLPYTQLFTASFLGTITIILYLCARIILEFAAQLYNCESLLDLMVCVPKKAY